MAFDVGVETVRVLEEGLAPLPAHLEPSQTVAVALWRGERYGAVLFVRLWRNGDFDCDCAIAWRAADGSWEEPGSWGGSGWIDDPLVRSETGWDGDPVLWLGLQSLERGADEVRACLGAASTEAAAIEVQHAGRAWTVPIDSPCGAFIVGLEAPGPATMRALDRNGRPLTGTERAA
jgi:hypothetical protein